MPTLFAAGNFGTQKFMLESSLELLRRAQAAAEAGDASPVITAQIECLPALIACEHDLVVLAGLALDAGRERGPELQAAILAAEEAHYELGAPIRRAERKGRRRGP